MGGRVCTIAPAADFLAMPMATFIAATAALWWARGRLQGWMVATILVVLPIAGMYLAVFWSETSWFRVERAPDCSVITRGPGQTWHLWAAGALLGATSALARLRAPR